MASAVRKLTFATLPPLLIAMLAVMFFAGSSNQGLLEWTRAARLIFCLGVAAGTAMVLYLLVLSADPVVGTFEWIESRKRGGTQWWRRFLLAALAGSAVWATACFGFIERVALILEGPVAREPARLARPLSREPPEWCSLVSKVSTESGLKGDICMNRMYKSDSHWIPLLGCVDLDARAIVEVRRTFLGPVVSLVEITDVPRHCEHKRRKS